MSRIDDASNAGTFRIGNFGGHEIHITHDVGARRAATARATSAASGISATCRTAAAWGSRRRAIRRSNGSRRS